MRKYLQGEICKMCIRRIKGSKKIQQDLLQHGYVDALTEAERIIIIAISRANLWNDYVKRGKFFDLLGKDLEDFTEALNNDLKLFEDILLKLSAVTKSKDEKLECQTVSLYCDIINEKKALQREREMLIMLLKSL